MDFVGEPTIQGPIDCWKTTGIENVKKITQVWFLEAKFNPKECKLQQMHNWTKQRKWCNN